MLPVKGEHLVMQSNVLRAPLIQQIFFVHPLYAKYKLRTILQTLRKQLCRAKRPEPHGI